MSRQVAFITGGASGLGLHLTRSLIERGYCVVVADINLKALREHAKSYAWPEDSVLVQKLDVTSKSQWSKAWEGALERFSRVDLMFNVAGYLLPGYVSDTDFELIDRHIDINLKGLMYGSQLAASHMVKVGQGHIINIASLAGVAPIPGIGLYSASKFGVRGFTLALAQELKPFNVDVTVVCPDAIETPMLTLQEDYDEAALTFSGGKVLTVRDLEAAIFDRVLVKKPVEVTLPDHRGWTAKFISNVPAASFYVAELLKSLGRKKQQSRLQSGH